MTEKDYTYSLLDVIPEVMEEPSSDSLRTILVNADVEVEDGWIKVEESTFRLSVAFIRVADGSWKLWDQEWSLEEILEDFPDIVSEDDDDN